MEVFPHRTINVIQAPRNCIGLLFANFEHFFDRDAITPVFHERWWIMVFTSTRENDSGIGYVDGKEIIGTSRKGNKANNGLCEQAECEMVWTFDTYADEPARSPSIY